MSEQKRQGQIEIQLDDTVAQGNYANLAIISHSSSEFIIDFAAMLPGVTKAKVRSRIILTPEHAKRLLFSLKDNIAKYENNMGEISITPTNNLAHNDFGSNLGEA